MKTVSGTPGLFSMLKPEQSLEWSSFMCQTQHWAIPTCLNLFNLCCHLGAMLKWLFHKSSNWGSLKHSWVYRWNPPLESRCRADPTTIAASCRCAMRWACCRVCPGKGPWRKPSGKIKLGWKNPRTLIWALNNGEIIKWGDSELSIAHVWLQFPAWSLQALDRPPRQKIHKSSGSNTGTSKKESDLKNCQEFTIHIHTS